MFEKISAEDIDRTMLKAAAHIRSLTARVAELEQREAGRARFDHAEKIASLAVERGLMDEQEADAYADELVKSAEDLRTVEGFVARAASGAPLGRPLEKTPMDYAPDGDAQLTSVDEWLLSHPIST